MELKKSYLLLDNLFASGKVVSYERRQTIVGYGHDTDIACRVFEGCVKVISYTVSGNERIHFLYGPGDVFPMYSLLGIDNIRVSFVALCKTKLHVRPMKDVMQGLEREPYAMLALLTQQAELYGRIINLNLESAEQRLAFRLLSLCRKFGVQNGDHIVINLPLTIQEIADMVRLTRETTGKVLAQFEQRGFIILGRQQILVYPNELKQVVDTQSSSVAAV